MNDQVISRIQKLLNLSKSNGTQAEMELAMSHAIRLATEHGLDLAAMSQTEVVTQEKIEKQTIELGARFSVCQKFVNWLLGKHFNVKLVLSGGRYGGRRIYIVGKTSDVQIAEYVQGFLNREFMRLWRDAAKAHGLPAKDRNSYIYGLYQGLDAKLRDEKQNAEKDKFNALSAERGTDFTDGLKQNYALVLVDEKKRLEDAYKQFFPKLGKGTSRIGSIRNYGAMGMGMAAGRNISLNRGLGNGAGQKALR